MSPLLIPDGQLDLADVIEDELILALPVVPLKPARRWNGRRVRPMKKPASRAPIRSRCWVR